MCIYCTPAVKSHLRLRSSQQGSLFRAGSLFRCKGSFRERGRAGVRYSRGNRLGHVAPTGADAGAPSGRGGERGAGLTSARGFERYGEYGEFRYLERV